MKDTLNEIKSLMKRMENTPNGGSNYLCEVACKWRDVVGEEAFYDLLSGLNPGSRVTFGYVTQAKVEVPKGKKLNPATNRMNQFDDYETLGHNLGEEGKLINIIKLTIYNLPWQSQDSVNNSYGEWKKTRDELGSKYNVPFRQPVYKTDTNNYGNKGGINQYAGDNQELSTHTYTNLNMKDIRPISTTYYLVMDNGDVKPIDVSKLTLSPYKPTTSAIDKLRTAGATEEEVAPLLNMQYQRFEHSHVLFVSATPDTGIPTLLINNKLSDKIGGISGINTENIIKIAQDRYAKFLDKDNVNFINDEPKY